MAFPIIQTKATNLELTPELKELLNQKLTPLERFFPNDETDITCDVELERVTDQQSGKIFRAEVNLKLKGKLYRAETTEEQIEHAVDVVRDELKRELTKARDKEKSLLRKGNAAIKRIIRFGRE